MVGILNAMIMGISMSGLSYKERAKER